MTAPPLSTRDWTPDDESFVMSTWTDSYRYGLRDRERGAGMPRFRRFYVEPILRQSPRVVVLCSPGEPRALHGHAVATPSGLAWVYVTKDLRGHGYGRQLIDAVLGTYPDEVPVHFRWPWPSTRFVFRKFDRRAA